MLVYWPRIEPGAINFDLQLRKWLSTRLKSATSELASQWLNVNL